MGSTEAIGDAEGDISEESEELKREFEPPVAVTGRPFREDKGTLENEEEDEAVED